MLELSAIKLLKLREIWKFILAKCQSVISDPEIVEFKREVRPSKNSRANCQIGQNMKVGLTVLNEVERQMGGCLRYTR